MKPKVLAILLATAMAAGWAQDPNAGDAPDHGVARLSMVQGNVSIRHGDLGEPQAAGNNVPLVATDLVETGDQGFAEIQFDFGNMIRLAPSSEVRLSQLEYQQYQVQIAAGTTEFRVLEGTDAQVEISTPTVSVHPAQPGAYRVTVRPDGITEITVRSGEAEIYGPQGSENLAPGQTMDVRGGTTDPEFQMVAAIPMDDFDRFNDDRDRVMQQTASYQQGYVPPDVTGGESLDPYGQWQNDPTYGQVWVPSEPSDWAPYQEGRWSWEDYYGWTWISYDPWGWAPYHYGSWYQSRWGWAWWPGRPGHHYWRPALVGFFGWGGGIGVNAGFGFGNIGWVPLAPYEVYHPWYGAGIVSGRLSVTNVNVVSIYRNARVANGISSVRAGDFGRGRVMGAGMIRPTRTNLTAAGAIHGALPVARNSASRHFSDAVASTRGVPQTNSNMRFYSRGTAAMARGTAQMAPAWRKFEGTGLSGTRGGGAGAPGFGATARQNGAIHSGSAVRSGVTPRMDSTGRVGSENRSEVRPGGGPVEAPRNYGGQVLRQDPPGYSRGGSPSPGNSGDPAPQQNYRREGPPQQYYRQSPRQEAPRQEAPRREAPRQEAPRQVAPRPEPLRMNPPIVQQQRSAPPERNGGGGGGFNRGGGGGGGGHHGGRR